MTAPRRVARIITRLNIGGPSIQAITLSRDLRASYETCLIQGSLAAAEGDMTTLMPLGDTDTRRIEDLVRPISPLQDVRAFWKIYRVLCGWRPDIVHTHQAKAGALGRLAALLYNRTAGRKRPARLIHTYHGYVFEGYFGSLSTKVFLFVERLLARKTDVLIAISQQVRHDILQTYRIASDRQVRIIPLGFDLERLSKIGPLDRARASQALGIERDAFVVTTVGRLTGIKQHWLFLEMAARLAARSERFVFLIVGDGELRGDLQEQANKLGIGSRVRFLGWRGDLDCIYGATDVFVLTSRNEGTPVALIEAMASGVASVSTDVGGVRDVIASADCGELVPFGNVEALASAVQRFADTPALREQVGARARAEVVARFSIRRLMADISSLYTELLEKRGTIAKL